MGFGKFLKRAGGTIAGTALGGLSGGLVANQWGNLSGANARDKQRQDIERAAGEAGASITGGYGSARDHLTKARTEAEGVMRPGFARMRGEISSGYGRAKGFYDTPEIVASRQQLYQRALGKGGYGAETKAKMTATVGDEYGTGLRDMQNAVQSQYGDATAPGLTSESLAIGTRGLAQDRAKQNREIDIGDALLAQEQQTGAIGSLYGEAASRGALETGEAGALAGISADETQALANLASTHGMNLATLSQSEAELLANIILGKGANLAQTRDTTNYLLEIGKAAVPIASAAMSGGAKPA